MGMIRVTLDQVVDFEYGLGPSEVWRKDRSRMIQVSANIGEIPLTQAVKLLGESMDDLKLPEDYFYEVGGDYQTLMQLSREFLLMIIVIVVLIYLVLASIFESYRQPFIIMITVILACTGAIFSLWVTKTSINMGANIGLMMLAGIVVNNGIILVDHANALRSQRHNLYRILVQAARDRLRPVLMTTATTIFGLFPMAIDTGEGSNLWRPLAITVMGGLLFATPLTLVLVPAIYSIFEQFGKLISEIFDPRNWIKNIKISIGFIREIVKKIKFPRFFKRKKKISELNKENGSENIR